MNSRPIKTYFEDLKNFTKSIRPKRDWNFLLILFLILVILSLAFDGYIYHGVVNGDMFIDTSTKNFTFEKLNINGLQNVINNFEDKNQKMNSLKATSLIDPSL